MRLVDLSHPITAGMQVYPGDPMVGITPALTLESDGVAVAHLSLGSHTGTHMDAPRHVVAGSAAIDEIPLEWCVGEALVLRVALPDAHAEFSTAITEADLSCPVPRSVPRIVVIDTGWGVHFGTERAAEHPWLAPEMAERLWAAGARVLGVDTLSPDAPPSAAPPTLGRTQSNLPVHELWLGRGGVIVENLTNLSEIPEDCELMIVPLRLAGVDGSPVRAIARFDHFA